MKQGWRVDGHDFFAMLGGGANGWHALRTGTNAHAIATASILQICVISFTAVVTRQFIYSETPKHGHKQFKVTLDAFL